MKRIVILIAIAAVFAGAFAAYAQEPTTGSGGPITEGDLGGSVNFGSLMPLRSNDNATSRIFSLMYPTVVGVNPYTQNYGWWGEDGVSNAIGTGYEISDDGLTLTFHLRDDAYWNDGEPITAWDVKFSQDAIASGVIDSPLYGYYNYVADGNPVGVKEIKVLDDYTYQAVFEQAGCNSMPLAASIWVTPSHVWNYDGSPDFDFSVLVDSSFDTNPSVAYGPFEFASFNPGEAVAVKATSNWAEGTVVPSGFIYRDVPDATVEVEQFLAGELNFIDGPSQSRRADIRAADNVNYLDFPGLTPWDYMAFNLADPANPQPGLDADGNAIDQGHHPIFGDVRVRRAIQMATDVQGIIDSAVFGEGTQMASNYTSNDWAHDPNLNPVPYDPEGAAALLDEAGWPVGPDGVRICQGCMYAEEGTPFEFTLLTNQGNTRREAIGVVIQDELYDLGITVDFQAIDFNTLIDETFGAQTFDAYILGWGGGFPSDPDQTQFWAPSNDDPSNASSNSTSYNNPKVNELMLQAATVPGCDPAARAEIYNQIEKILQDDQPYVWLYVQNSMYAANKDVVNFDPYPNVPMWNVQSWQIPSSK